MPVFDSDVVAPRTRVRDGSSSSNHTVSLLLSHLARAYVMGGVVTSELLERLESHLARAYVMGVVAPGTHNILAMSHLARAYAMGGGDP